MYRLTVTEHGKTMFQRDYASAKSALGVMQSFMRCPTLWGQSTGVIEYVEC